MTKFQFKMFDHREDKWLEAYDEIVAKDAGNVQLKPSNPDYVKWSLHHILPKSEFPEFRDDPANHLFCSLEDHLQLHYLLWKHDPKYARAFWFICVYFMKHAGYKLADGEYEQLKRDLKVSKKQKSVSK